MRRGRAPFEIHHTKSAGAGFRTVALCLLAVAAAMSACAVPTIPSRVIYETPTDFVRLEPDPYAFHEITQTLHSHPASLDADQMTRLLKGFLVQEHRNA